MLAEQILDTFDFDAWMALARTDPHEFEEYRQLVIEFSLQHNGNSPQLRRLQFRIDAERFRARTPLKACLRLSSMMWDELYELNDAIDRLTHVSPNSQPRHAGVPERKSATIIPFPRINTEH